MNVRVLFASLGLALAVGAQAQGNYTGTHTGEGTFYGYGGGGNCSLPMPAMYTAAMNHSDYNTAEACGACVEVTNLNTMQSVIARVDGRCPECAAGDVDLSQAAFEQISPIGAGRIPISWTYVSCSAASVKLYFKEGSSQWWTAVQVRDHRNPVKSLAYRTAGSGSAYTTLPREIYNYFVATSGMGPGPYDIKITDVFDQTLTFTGVSLAVTTEIDLGQQFPKVLSSGGSGGGTGGGGTTLPAKTTLEPINDWGSGYCTNVNVTNPNTTPLNWTVNLTIAGTVSTTWNTTWSQSGTTLTAAGVDWNKTLAAGASTQFGFCANR